MSESYENLTRELKQLGQLTQPDIKNLVELLNTPSAHIQRPEGLAAIAGQVIDVSLAETLVRQLFHLQSASRRSGYSVSELLDIQFDLTKNVELELSDRQLVEQGIQNLRVLAGVESVSRTVKAVELAYDSDNLLQRTRILTDVRPIFSEDASEINGAIVSHTLRLRYDSAGIDHELSLALDTSDIHKLIEDCQRALQKEKTAQQQLCDRANVPSLQAEDLE